MTKSQTTYSEYIARINRVIDYISKNLDKQLSVSELAKIAYFSEYHFHRIFSMIVGQSINGYVRRMRLEKAATSLRIERKLAVTEIAMKFGFSSSANFAKAFKSHFGLSPSEFRKNIQKSSLKNSKNGKLKSRNGKVKEEFNRDYSRSIDHLPNLDSLGIELKSLPPLHVAYVRTLKGYAQEPIEQVWDKLLNWGQSRGLIHDGTLALGIEHDDPVLSGIENCRYDACITVPESISDFQGEVGIHDLPGGIYVVYRLTIEGEMEVGMSDGYLAIFRWIAQNGLTPTNSPSYSLYLNAKEVDQQGAPAEVCICVRVETLYSS